MVLYNSRVKLYDFNVLDSRVTLEAEYYIETVDEELVVKRRLIESHRFFLRMNSRRRLWERRWCLS